ncbi:MAG TPA: lysophospholipid acyltransferase family protein [Terriglobales bacterium]|nr:lysophospholipid acyltransferase family protein [Terriglobales bacterium]
MRNRLEYAPVWLLVRGLAIMPAFMARAVGIVLARTVCLLHGRLRQVGMRNLQLAFPQMPAPERRRILRRLFTNLGRQLGDFCRFPRYRRQNISQLVAYDGFEHFERAHARGKGVLFLTAHFGGWEISSFMHALHGHPMHILVRPLDNPYLDRLVTWNRTISGNHTIPKRDFARAMLAALRAGEIVGILMDQNMLPEQGVFVDFFGIPACTSTLMARMALRTDAAVVPAFCPWDPALGRYRMRFDPALPLIRSGDEEADILANTAAYTKVIEDYARRYPEQWLWVHRRWKTRPPAEKPLY